MKIIIKNSAPSDSRQEKWGDYHFGRSLSKYLRRLGAKVKTHYKKDWHKRDRANAVLVIRGKYPYRPKSRAIHILWVISHPGHITLEECEAYDAVCVASHPHAESLKRKISVPVFALLQCTDTEEFASLPKQERDNVIFVGNTRGVRRPCVSWALELGLPLKIWGRGWDEWLDPQYIVADYIPNEQLGRLYNRSKFTLNDHWHDMKSLGYINNRIFDALACGLPLISDFHVELHRLFPEEILFFSDKGSFFSSVQQLLASYTDFKRQVDGIAELIRQEYSFEKRAEFLYDLIGNLNKTKKEPMSFWRLNTPEKQSPWPCNAPLFSKDRLDHGAQINKDGYLCPLCGSNFPRFIRNKTGLHTTSICPGCKSREYDRWLWIYFSAILWPKLGPGTKHFLHISPSLHLNRALQQIEGLDYISADPNSETAMVQIDLERFDFPDQRFNLIIFPSISNANIHVVKTIGEIYRTLISGNGYAIITDDQRGASSPVSFQEKDTVGSCDEESMRALESILKNTGFEVSKIRVHHELGSMASDFLGIGNQPIFECFKN